MIIALSYNDTGFKSAPVSAALDNPAAGILRAAALDEQRTGAARSGRHSMMFLIYTRRSI
jgi:hypothetical protein